jgi:hypothetical protein
MIIRLKVSKKNYWARWFLASGLILAFVFIILLGTPVSKVYAQQPTGSIPTVTGTPTGPMVTVYSDQLFIDVYSGPSSYNYDSIGIMAAGTSAPAIGYSQDGNWIEIVYLGVPGGVGWVYAPFVSISPGSLPKLPSPPTPAPKTTPTLNPTYVAAYGLQQQPTSLPTFTAPAPLKIPTFSPNESSGSKIPYGLVILILALIGFLGAIISFLRGNR